MTFAELAPLINTVGLIFLAAAIWFTQWRSGSTQVSSQVINNYEQLTKQQKDQIELYKTDLEKVKAILAQAEKNFIEKLAKLEGQLLEKEKRAKDLELLVTNRNPELEQVLREIRDFMRSLLATNSKQTAILEATQTPQNH